MITLTLFAGAKDILREGKLGEVMTLKFSDDENYFTQLWGLAEQNPGKGKEGF